MAMKYPEISKGQHLFFSSIPKKNKLNLRMAITEMKMDTFIEILNTGHDNGQTSSKSGIFRFFFFFWRVP